MTTPVIAPQSRNAYVINMWHLTITDMFYISIIHAEGKVKVVPVCSVPGKTVLNFKCPMRFPAYLSWPSSSCQLLGRSLVETQLWHRYVNGLKVCHPHCVRSIIQNCSVYISIYTYSHEQHNITISSDI